MLRLVHPVIFVIFILTLAACSNHSESTTTQNTDSVSVKDSIVFTKLFSETIDMENLLDGRISSEQFSSGKLSNKLSKDVEFGVSFTKILSEIPSFSGIQKITVEVKSFSKQKIKDAVLVVSIDNGKEQKNIFWDGKPFQSDTLSKWNNNAYSYEIKAEYLKPEYTLSVYAWNKTKEEFYIDDIVVNIFGTTKIMGNTSISNSNFFYDFESAEGIVGAENIKITTAHSGKKAIDLTGGNEYGPSIVKTIKEIATVPFKKVSASVWVYPTSEKPNLVITASSVNEKNNETIFWEGKSTENSEFPINTWTKLNASFNIPSEKLSVDNKIQINIWNKGKTNVIVDDLEIVYGLPNERKGIPSLVDLNAISNKTFVPVKNTPPFPIQYLNKQKVNLSVLNNFTSNDNVMAGNFVNDKNNVDELLCVNAGSAKIIAYNTSNNAFEIVWEANVSATPLFGKINKLLAGDFDANGSDELLVIDTKNGMWQLFRFSNKQWEPFVTGKKSISKKWFDKGSASSITSVFTNNKTALTIVSQKSITTLTMNNGEFIEKELPITANNKLVVNPNDLFFEGSFENGIELIKLNTEWRFDLKLVSAAQTDFTIKSMLDFKGYENDFNPKYYEFTQLIAGNFLTSKKTSLLTISCNCGDTNFNGIECNTIENIKTLPNTISIFSIENK